MRFPYLSNFSRGEDLAPRAPSREAPGERPNSPKVRAPRLGPDLARRIPLRWPAGPPMETTGGQSDFRWDRARRLKPCCQLNPTYVDFL